MKPARARRPAAVDVAIEGRLAFVTLARPATGNVLDEEVMHGLGAAAEALDDVDGLCAVVLRARGPVFSRGLPARTGWPPPAWPDGVGAIARLAVPLVAAIRGDATGWGLALALACDLRVVAAGARLSSPEVAGGGLPGGGLTQRLTRLVGPARAAEMLLLGTAPSGRTAVAWGLATRAVAAAVVEREALGMARALATRGPLALRFAKEAALRALDLPLDDGVRLEHDLYVLLQTTRDRREGVRAFLERRPPRFGGE